MADELVLFQHLRETPLFCWACEKEGIRDHVISDGIVLYFIKCEHCGYLIVDDYHLGEQWDDFQIKMLKWKEKFAKQMKEGV